MPVVTSTFRPPWWLRNRHLQTVWPGLFRPGRNVDLVWERIALPDGDFLDLAWTHRGTGPIVLILHGLQGGLRSHYALGLLQTLERAGFRVAFMHFRGCSGEPNRLPRGYHSGETGDTAFVLELLARRFPESALGAVGISLGGNVLLKYLGETGRHTPLRAAVAISVPFDLADAAQTLETGLGRLYGRYLLGSCVRATKRKFALVDPPFPLPDLDAIPTLRAFDDAITAPLHGFADATDYYRRSSSRPFLRAIEVPTLIIHARDDPFMTEKAIPDDTELSGAVLLELSRHGGHVGFLAPGGGLRPSFWLEQRVRRFLRAQLVSHPSAPPHPPDGSHR
jgi:predicted alpha/beta-fold hydrolase